VTTQRIADRSNALGSLAGLQASASRLASLQSKLSSGRQITKPSDNPTGTTTALELRGQLQRTNQYVASGSDGIAWLSQIDSTLSSVVKATQNVRDLVLQGANTATNDPNSENALAQQVDAIRSTLLGLSNTTYQGRPVFGGTTAGTTAYDSTGAYQGNSGAVTRTIGDGDSVTVGATGPAVFGADGSNLFDLLSTISNDLRTNTAGLSGDLSSLDTALHRVSSQQAVAGATYNRIETVQSIASDTTLQLKTQLSDIQDVDVAELAVQVSSANVAYQASLQTTASIKQTSLLDFLR
jgi:flagellar hook-associated protein 3 FlgL